MTRSGCKGPYFYIERGMLVPQWIPEYDWSTSLWFRIQNNMFRIKVRVRKKSFLVVLLLSRCFSHIQKNGNVFIVQSAALNILISDELNKTPWIQKCKLDVAWIFWLLVRVHMSVLCKASTDSMYFIPPDQNEGCGYWNTCKILKVVTRRTRKREFSNSHF